MLPWLALASNQDSSGLSRLLGHFGLTDRFEWLMISDEIGFKKPDRRFFNEAISQLPAPAREISFVGNNPLNDMKGASGAGINRLYLFDPEGDHDDTVVDVPFTRVSSLMDIEAKEDEESDCLGCRLNRDPTSVPGGLIKRYRHWGVEHIIEPIPVRGWLILKTLRHTEGIAGMNAAEAAELGTIMAELPQRLKEATGAEMIYVFCMTEAVRHLHIHLIPRLPDSVLMGTELFERISAVRADPESAVPVQDCLDLIDDLKRNL